MKEPIKQYKPKEPVSDIFREKLKLPDLKKESQKIFKQVNCPSCSQPVGADHINLDKSLAKCGACHVIFSIEEEVADLKIKEKIKEEFFRPEGVDLFFYKGDMEITVKQPVHWIDSSVGMLLPVIAGFSFFICYDKGYSFFVPTILVAISLFFIYRLITYFKAKTFIDVNDQHLKIRHRPSNYKKDKTFAAEDIDQIYLKHSSVNSGYFILNMIVNGPGGQTHQELVSVSTISKAKYLEQEIEKYLGIEDRKVPEATA